MAEKRKLRKRIRIRLHHQGGDRYGVIILNDYDVALQTGVDGSGMFGLLCGTTSVAILCGATLLIDEESSISSYQLPHVKPGQVLVDHGARLPY
ncbi:MAG: hypothetical protein UX77_C0003G0025 [Parcubacteria group bacterium GW2011_GWA1_47_11]|nr:MAG: hypothetical protein UX77_C0003G0025 [Parcubacteria group bacterium GW2011_GWA1_47_11]